MPTPTPAPGRSAPLLLVSLAGLAALLRALPAARASLWLDELHTLYHASQPDLGAFFAGLRADNHPPLAFLLVRASRWLFGSSELALRAPSVLAGTACVLVAARLSRALPGARIRVAGPLLVATSSLLIAASAEARMYALLGLVVLWWIERGLQLSGGARGSAGLAAATFAGLHTHYHFLHALLVLLPLLLWLAPRPAGARIALACVCAALASAPWYAWGFRAQLSHGLPPGGAGASARALGEGFVHLLFHGASLAGPLKPVFAAAGLAAALGAAAAALRFLRHREPAVRRAGALLSAAAFALPAWAALAAAVLPRAGFNWMYLGASAAPFALLAAAELDAEAPWARARRAAAGFVQISALALAVLHARGPAREDYRGASEYVLAEAHPGDVVLAADWQPALFPHGLGWRYYSGRAADPPETLAVGPGFAVEAPERLDAAPRAFLVGRSLRPEVAVLATLRARFPRERVERFGDSLFVHVFER